MSSLDNMTAFVLPKQGYNNRLRPYCHSFYRYLFFLILYLFHEVQSLIPNITQLPVNDLINELMNFSNYYNINLQLFKYISACFDFRDKLLAK